MSKGAKTLSLLSDSVSVSKTSMGGIPTGGLEKFSIIATLTDSTPSNKTVVAGTREVTDIVFPADTGAFEVDTITCVADTGEYEVQTVTMPATAGATQADYIVLENAAGTKWAFWIDIDDAGTQPTGAIFLAVTAGNRVRLDLSTGGTAAQNGTIFHTASSVMTNVGRVDGGAGTVTLTQQRFGNTTAGVVKNADDSGAGSITTATTTAGVASEYAGKYFNISTATDAILHYVWFTVDGVGTDPAPASRTAIPVALAKGVTANAAADAVAAALDALPGYVAPNPAAAAVTCTRAALGTCTNAANVDVGGAFAIVQATQGAASNLQNTYFKLTTTAGVEHYWWFNVSSLGVDPAPSGTGHAIAISAGAAADTGVAAAAKTAIDAVTGFASTRSSATVTVTHSARSAVTDGSVGTLPAGGSLTVTTQGVTSTVSTSADTLTITAHGFLTGTKLTELTSTATLPAGLSTSTAYYVIKVDDDTIKLATSADNAVAGTAVNITDTGTEAATHTLVVTTLSHVIKLQASNDGSNWKDIASSSQTVTSTGSVYWDSEGSTNSCMTTFKYVRPHLTVTSGQATHSWTAFMYGEGIS